MSTCSAVLCNSRSGGEFVFLKEAYGQAALNWAATFKRKESGLAARKWWLLAEKRRRTPDEIERKVKRDAALRKKKENFKVEHLGMLLDRHERYCASRTGNEKVSPGVRWGLWWDALTGHRRGSGTWIAREDLEFAHSRLPTGWGLATWQPDVMKTQDPFTLPIPPFGLLVARGCMRDQKKADARAGVERVNMVTGIGGGMVRDVLLAEIPTVLRADLYAVAALAAAAIVVIGHMLQLPVAAVTAVALILCFLLRIMAITRGWHLPIAKGAERRKPGVTQKEDKTARRR